MLPTSQRRSGELSSEARLRGRPGHRDDPTKERPDHRGGWVASPIFSMVRLLIKLLLPGQGWPGDQQTLLLPGQGWPVDHVRNERQLTAHTA